MSDAKKAIAEFAAQLAAKSPDQKFADLKFAGAKPADPAAAEPRVVIRPAGAAPTGVRVSATLNKPPAAVGAAGGRALPAPAAKPGSRPAAKGKAKGKPRRPATPRRPLLGRLREVGQNFRFRLLPLTIFVAVLMLGVRVGDLWRIATRDAKLPEFPVSLAQGPQNTPAPSPVKSGMPSQNTASQNAAMANPPKDGPPPAQGGANMPAAGPAPNGPLGPIDNKELLQHFAERRAEIERRTKEMEQREALLAAAEKRIDQKVAEMEKVRGDIQKLMNQGDEKQSAQLESLVKIYETMKPKEAARIFEELEMPVLLGVIQKMKEQKTAPILAAMDPVKAKEVTSALIERRVPSMAK